MSSILQELAKVAKEFEAKTGAPPLSKFGETIDKLPDQKQLKEIKELLSLFERISQSAPNIEHVITLVRELKSVPVEQLETWLKLLRKIEGIMKKAPEELLSFLTSLKED